ncbi:MAG: hypothetical protein WA197_11430 [Candidatus Acidiferrales bacterium]
MKKLSGRMKTLANSVVAKAESSEGLMAVMAVVVLTMSLAEILSHRKRSGPHATSTGCDPEVFRHRLARALLQY